jgi:hypothetical protein
MAGSFTATAVPTAVVEQGLQTPLSIAYDASAGQLNVSVSAASAAPFAIRVYDLTGRLVKHTESSASGYTNRLLSVADLPRGLYLVSAKIGDARMTRKIEIH